MKKKPSAPIKSTPKAAPKKVAPPAAILTNAKSKKIEVKAKAAPATSSDEDEEDDMEGIGSSGRSGGGMAMATAPIPSAEPTHSLKNFRHHPDMENFYRFIFDNDLRFEALAIIDEVLGQKKMKKKIASQKARAH